MKAKKLFRIRKIITLLTLVIGCYLCLQYAEECAEGVKKGILFCVETLVPSLYLFMALSSALIRSGYIVTLSRPLKGIAYHLFRLPPSGLAVILLSILGGYPVGARCISVLYEQGSVGLSDAKKTAYIAVCAGPGFLLNYVGCALLNNRQAGTALLVSAILGVLLTGVIIGRVVHSDPLPYPPSAISSGSGNLLTKSVADASDATIRMCGMVVVCTAMITVIAEISPDQTVTDIASALIEITEGCHRMCGSYPLYMIAFFLGFGGISVHLQIYTGLGELSIRKGFFILFRVIQGIITAAAAYSYLMVFPVEQEVFNSTDASLTLSKSATLAGSAALVISSFCFIGSMRRSRRNHSG